MKLFLCILAASHLHAANVKLTVKVIDGVTLAGISGASVSVIQIAPSGNQPFNADATTDASGSFTIDVPAPSRLWVPAIKAAGYAPHSPDTHIEIAAEAVSVTYSLTRTGAISGRVVDGDSGDAIAGVAVESLQATWLGGRRDMRRSFKSTVTGKDGSFELRDLPPADYVLDLNSYLWDGKKPVQPVEGYPLAVWPGGGDFRGAAPFNVAYGGVLRLGDIKIHKRELSTLTVATAGGVCSKGQTYDVVLKQFSFSSSFTRAVAQAPCGETAVFGQVTPGSYEIAVEASWQPEAQRERGAFPIEIVKRDEKATVVVTPPIAIHGRVTTDHDAPRPAGIEIHLWARGSKLTGGFSHITSFASSKVKADGRFEGKSYVPAGGEIEVDPSRLPASHYIREVRYDGVSYSGDTFVIHPGAAHQDLEVVLSSRAAALSGTVRTADGKVVPDARVLLSLWPADVVTEYPFGVEEASTSASGGYSFTHLRPGSYRVIAVSAAVRAKLEEPGVMLALFASAESFELGEQAAAVRQLTPSAPR